MQLELKNAVVGMHCFIVYTITDSARQLNNIVITIYLDK